MGDGYMFVLVVYVGVVDLLHGLWMHLVRSPPLPLCCLVMQLPLDRLAISLDELDGLYCQDGLYCLMVPIAMLCTVADVLG